MHSVEIHELFARINSIFFRTGIWQRGSKYTAKGIGIKLFSSFYYLLLVLSLLIGAIINDEMANSIFLSEVTIAGAITFIRLWLLTWKQHQILDLLNRICVFSIRNDDDFKLFNGKLRAFIKFVLAFLVPVTFIGGTASVVCPLLRRGKSLFVEIAFPMDYRNSETGLWMANIFFFSANILSFIATFFGIETWYLLLTCSLRYDLLGSDLRNLGQRNEKGELKLAPQRRMQNHFLEDLKSSINTHLHIRKLTDELGNFLSGMLFFQFCTSGLSICFSVYCLAFGVGTTLLERIIVLLMLLYFISDLLVITYFGNEIKFASNRLSYNLYESDWYNQSEDIQRSVIIFGEYLQQPQVVMVGKLYPLTLQTFTRIFNSAYSMFNILKSFQ